MRQGKQILVICHILLLCLFGLAAQTPSQAIDRARVLYNQGSFQDAYDLIESKVLAKDTEVKILNSASSLLTYMGVSEYEFKNYKNAYAAFKKSLVYQPTNALAIQNITQMERELDVLNLKNSKDSSSAKPSASPSAPVSPTELNALISRIWEEENKLSMAEKTESYAKENRDLKGQLDQQRMLNQQTLQLLKKIAEAQASQQKPQIIVQSDPNLQTLTNLVGTQNELLSKGSWTNTLVVVSLIVVALVFIGIFAFILLFSLRARRRRASVSTYGLAGLGQAAATEVRAEMLASPERPLLEYLESSASSSKALMTEEDVQKQVLRAERLTKMLDEAKTGGLSWDMVKAYMDDLDTELKAEILSIVEARIEEGDLISNQAVLPIIFPFLTDYDDYLRDRAEKAAAAALIEEESDLSNKHEGPFEVKALLSIPERLKVVLKGRDQSIVTAKLSRSIGRHMGFSADDCQRLYRAALAHDAGYLMLDKDKLQEILAKPDISPQEFEFIQSHTIKGPEYFGEAELPADIREAILFHHERNDGSGYPDGLKKDQIPLFARVIGVAESFAALMASRPHRDKTELGNALAIIRDARFKFDHDIVEALSAVVQEKGMAK